MSYPTTDTSSIETLAYITGVAIGDGNLTNPNGRATRLRITCNTQYPNLIKRISESIQILLPNNKVSIIYTAKAYINISCYSNKWENWLGWKSDQGSKLMQEVSIQNWIIENQELSIYCLRGLFETDGSIYMDRGYKMVNLVTYIPRLAEQVVAIIEQLGYKVHAYKYNISDHYRYNIRISREVEEFIAKIGINKS